MKKLVGLFVLPMGLLAACGDEKQSVVNLSYIDAHWNVSKYSLEQPEVLESVSETLRACTGDLTTELKGDLIVFDTVVASRPPFTNAGDDYMYKTVTYVQGDELYAICRDMTSLGLKAEVVSSFPEEFMSGNPVDHVPAVLPIKESDRESFLQADIWNEHQYELEAYPDSLFSFSHAISGELEIAIEGRPSLFPLISFEPATATMGDIQMMLGFSQEESLPYVLMRHNEGYFSNGPLEVTFDATEKAPRYDSLNVKRLPLEEDIFVSGESYPIYEFTYIKDGESITETVTLTYREEALISEEERDLPENLPAMQFPDQTGRPFVYLHKKPFSREKILSYPDVIKAAGTDMDELIEAIKAAGPVDRRGDMGDYHLLTILDGLQGQEFEVTYKQRSKKLDVYVTDRVTEETYKLTSEGAETFLSYFPDLKKK
ncbi:hypothetical protein [Exiguobacterium sp. AM39-5BH]|uniref:hypothetical protein n=1 Tax=Exiguobacterium sp. AM39-5BH TaxID=2292355 RepID=UPI000FE1931D|nr:hypothetical protein [Exiguobacterium sp. AM39-5BH]RHB52049.1 hypothetical protein DW881_02575 [Exiguobacterium sp. AM39-5BH]